MERDAASRGTAGTLLFYSLSSQTGGPRSLQLMLKAKDKPWWRLLKSSDAWLV